MENSQTIEEAPGMHSLQVRSPASIMSYWQQALALLRVGTHLSPANFQWIEHDTSTAVPVARVMAWSRPLSRRTVGER
jgi:hypothetical protein